MQFYARNFKKSFAWIFYGSIFTMDNATVSNHFEKLRKMQRKDEMHCVFTFLAAAIGLLIPAPTTREMAHI
jgi:hypothetical protein